MTLIVREPMFADDFATATRSPDTKPGLAGSGVDSTPSIPLGPPDNVLGERHVNWTQFLIALIAVGLMMVGGITVVWALYRIVRALLEVL